MSTSPNLALPLLAAGQSQKHVTHNEALLHLDALVQLTVESRTLAAPPAAPQDGARYIVPASASGAWAGKTGTIAAALDGAWTFLTPKPGWRVWVVGEAVLLAYSGGIWIDITGKSNFEMLGIHATPDLTNRLTVASTGSLFNHDGAGHRLTINKAAEPESATLVFQSGYSGRGEIGLAGNNHLSFKTSPDGTNWREALVVNCQNGQVHLPETAVQGPFDNLLINHRFRINQRGFAGGALANGVFGFDRWRAVAAGTSVALSGDSVQLTGAVAQVIETAQWTETSFASQILTFAVDDLSGGALTVTLNGVSATLAAGSGTRWATLVVPAGAVGNLTLTLAGTGISFRRVQLVRGIRPAGWSMRPMPVELALCQRYFQIVAPVTYGPMGVAIVQTATRWAVPLSLPEPPRADPLVTYSGSSRIYLYSGANSLVTAATFANRANNVITIGVDIESSVGTSMGMLYAVLPLPRISFDCELTG